MELIDQPALHVARFELPRNYRLFSLLAGVRYDPQELRGFEPLYEPRGPPSDISSTVFEACTYAIDDELAALDVDGYCSREAAERWIANDDATYCDPAQERITDPDWHSVSWLTCDELEIVATRYQQLTGERDAWLDAIIGTMHAFITLHINARADWCSGSKDSRLVIATEHGAAADAARGDKIGRFLTTGSDSIARPPYQCGAAERPAVRRRRY